MADQEAAGVNPTDLKKKRAFRKFTFRGVDLDQLLDLNTEQLMATITLSCTSPFITWS